MRSFAYRGFTDAGKSARGTIEAESASDARERLTRRAIYPEHISPVSEFAGRRSACAMGYADRSAIYLELSTLTQAGVTLERALDLLAESPELAGFHARLVQTRDALREGASFAAAWGTDQGVPDFETAILEVGERTGQLPAMFAELARFLDEQAELRSKVKAALTYPSIVIVVAVLIAVGMLCFVVPWAAGVLTEAGESLPAITRALLLTGKVVKWAGLPVLLLVTLGGLYQGRRWREDRGARESVHRFAFRVPVLRRALHILSNQRFAQALAMLLEGGVPLVQGLPLAGRATGNVWITEQIARDTQSVRDGAPLADAIQGIPPLASGLSRWIRAGEASGQLVPMLRAAGERYRSQWDLFVRRSLGLLEPVLVLVIGLFTALVALSVLLPILAMSQTIQ